MVFSLLPEFSFFKKKDVGTALTAPTIMYLMLTVAFLAAAVVCYFLYKGIKVQCS